MSDLTQLVIVTALAAAALAVLMRPYVMRPSRKKAGATGDAGCPGCGTCDDAPAPASGRR
jgi:hypothetical protein